MQLSLRSCATAVVAVLGAGLIYLPPPPATGIGQPSVALAAAWDIVDVAGPIDAAVSGFVDLPVPSPADDDMPVYLDPEFWDLWWSSLWTINPVISWLVLVNVLSEIPIIGPAFTVVALLSYIPLLFGPHMAVADGWATGLGAGFDAGEVAQLADAGGGVGTADDPLSEWFSAPGVSAGLAEADPFTDFFQQISNYLQGAFLLGVLVFGGVVANVAQFFSDAYDWFAGIFGFEPYGAMDTLGGALPEIGTALLAPALASDLGSALGDITVIPALDFAGGRRCGPHGRWRRHHLCAAEWPGLLRGNHDCGTGSPVDDHRRNRMRHRGFDPRSGGGTAAARGRVRRCAAHRRRYGLGL
ncbi:hypothetical protein [Mycolicibacter arupensis]|uniref:hypothetical protein n=1 Tax=Mycolicibacter arupensis TaxID=342002 RepID=UPI0023F30467|nr:hypothetical protein [Mycolicibacter arupensis]